MRGTFIILIYISVILTSCQNVRRTEQTTLTSTVEKIIIKTPSLIAIKPILTNSPIGDGGLITGIPCEAPCFFGVAPAKTSFDEALNTLPKFGRNACIENASKLTIHCDEGIFIGANSSTRLVNRIGYYPAGDVSVSGVIQKFGEPNIVAVLPGAVPESSKVSITLFFDDLMMKIQLPEIDGSSYLLEGDTEVYLINYFDLEIYQDVTNDNYFSQSWKGYGVYKINR